MRTTERLSLIVMLAALSFAAEAAAPEIAGYFEMKPGRSGERNRFCIELLGQQKYRVSMATVHCPSVECLNARLDGMQFDSMLRDGHIRYSLQTGCTVSIQFLKNGAKVSGTTESCGTDHPYFWPNGLYRHISATPDLESCGR